MKVREVTVRCSFISKPQRGDLYIVAGFKGSATTLSSSSGFVEAGRTEGIRSQSLYQQFTKPVYVSAVQPPVLTFSIYIGDSTCKTSFLREQLHLGDVSYDFNQIGQQKEVSLDIVGAGKVGQVVLHVEPVTNSDFPVEPRYEFIVRCDHLNRKGESHLVNKLNPFLMLFRKDVLIYQSEVIKRKQSTEFGRFVLSNTQICNSDPATTLRFEAWTNKHPNTEGSGSEINKPIGSCNVTFQEIISNFKDGKQVVLSLYNERSKHDKNYKGSGTLSVVGLLTHNPDPLHPLQQHIISGGSNANPAQQPNNFQQPNINSPQQPNANGSPQQPHSNFLVNYPPQQPNTMYSPQLINYQQPNTIYSPPPQQPNSNDPPQQLRNINTQSPQQLLNNFQNLNLNNTPPSPQQNCYNPFTNNQDNSMGTTTSNPILTTQNSNPNLNLVPSSPGVVPQQPMLQNYIPGTTPDPNQMLQYNNPNMPYNYPYNNNNYAPYPNNPNMPYPNYGAPNNFYMPQNVPNTMVGGNPFYPQQPGTFVPPQPGSNPLIDPNNPPNNVQNSFQNSFQPQPQPQPVQYAPAVYHDTTTNNSTPSASDSPKPTKNVVDKVVFAPKKDHKKPSYDSYNTSSSYNSSSYSPSSSNGTARWFWKNDSGQWIEYDKPLSDRLEKGYKDKDGKIRVDDQRFVDCSNTSSMLQRRYDDFNKVRTVKREWETRKVRTDTMEALLGMGYEESVVEIVLADDSVKGRLDEALNLLSPLKELSELGLTDTRRNLKLLKENKTDPNVVAGLLL